jgi:hypothetical protein
MDYRETAIASLTGGMLQAQRLVVLELGIGPRNQLIKAPLMRLVDREPYGTYITVNLGEVFIGDHQR